jgi:exonuclease VII small subunit
MRLYDEGTALVKTCTEKITAAEQKVRLVQMKNGAVTEEEFSGQ